MLIHLLNKYCFDLFKEAGKEIPLPGWLSSKESACNAGDQGLIPGLGIPAIEKRMATHSSIFAWEIPWTEEPGRLQSTGLQGVGHDLMT